MEPSASQLPLICAECIKLTMPRPHKNCRLCKDLDFDESILCKINRLAQEDSDFECRAFQPAIKLVIPLKSSISESDKAFRQDSKKKPFSELLNSDKIKYERALALQRLDHDPEGVFVQLKYHIAWNVLQRKPLFSPAKDFINIFVDAFQRLNDVVRGFSYLLYLAPDHIHVYVESDGEISIEEIVQGMKRFLNKAITENFPILSKKLGRHTDIWDKAYFVETIG